MKAHDEEFRELQNMFEKNELKYGHFSGNRAREKNKKLVGIWYENLQFNELFKMYMHGYEFGKLVERLGKEN